MIDVNQTSHQNSWIITQIRVYVHLSNSMCLGMHGIHFGYKRNAKLGKTYVWFLDVRHLFEDKSLPLDIG